MKIEYLDRQDKVSKLELGSMFLSSEMDKAYSTRASQFLISQNGFANLVDRLLSKAISSEDLLSRREAL